LHRFHHLNFSLPLDFAILFLVLQKGVYSILDDWSDGVLEEWGSLLQATIPSFHYSMTLKKISLCPLSFDIHWNFGFWPLSFPHLAFDFFSILPTLPGRHERQRRQATIPLFQDPQEDLPFVI
jgi:hypothetical protein